VHNGVLSNRELRRQLELLPGERWFELDLIVRRPEDVALNLADYNPFYTHHIFGAGQMLYDRTASRAR
jgi:hypothetical protein